ncbi:ribonuclease H-like domain-containing protein [Tanacetum coccineum]|uniref:Ribonuclease H-like domain-containing protein n=1 Tax=Tanacetum coccineum TaxID=301880 RepID=A0ABQ4Z8I7_9ASTR
MYSPPLRFPQAHMVNCNPSQTPVDTESKLGDDGDPVFDSTLYQSVTGSLQYLTFTRPYISYAMQQLFSSSITSLVAYSDADWAGCPATRSVEAEYRGVANAVAETCWLRNLLRELHTPFAGKSIRAMVLVEEAIFPPFQKALQFSIHLIILHAMMRERATGARSHRVRAIAKSDVTLALLLYNS